MVQTYSDNKYIYSVDMMFVYIFRSKLKPIKMKTKNLLYQLQYDGWGDPEKNIKYSAIEVIDNPQKHEDDFERILKADLRYPIIISHDGNIVDGIHRLSKAYLEKIKFLKAYSFNENLMKKFIIAKKDQWDKVDKMEIYDLINIYVDRFCLNNHNN